MCERRNKLCSRAEPCREERVVVKGKPWAAEAPTHAVLGAGRHNAALADLLC